MNDALVELIDLAKYYPITSGVLRRVIGQVQVYRISPNSLAQGVTLLLEREVTATRNWR